MVTKKQEEKKLISVKEFSQIYNIGLNKSYDITKMTGFPSIRVGKKILVISSEIDKFLYSRIGEQF